VPTEVVADEKVTSFWLDVPNVAVPVGGTVSVDGVGVQFVPVFQVPVPVAFQVAFCACAVVAIADAIAKSAATVSAGAKARTARARAMSPA